jgi:hypothetical protein
MTGPELLAVIVFQRRHVLRATGSAPRTVTIGEAEDRVLVSYLCREKRVPKMTMNGAVLYDMTVTVKGPVGVFVS